MIPDGYPAGYAVGCPFGDLPYPYEVGTMKNEHMSKRNKTLLGVLIALCVVAVLGAGIFALSRLEKEHDVVPEGAGEALSLTNESEPLSTEAGVSEPEEGAEAAVIYYNGQAYKYNDNLSTLLILGIDDAELTESETYRNNSQADFLLVAVFDPDSQECTLIQINRDTMTDVPEMDSKGKKTGFMAVEQIALAHTYGNGLEKSCENTVEAVSWLLFGVTIDNYFAVTMDAIPIINDLVGGVTVTVEDDFSGVDDTLVQGETVTLTAENVEHFVRERKGITDDPTNLNRMARQRVYMRGLFEAMKAAYMEDSAFILDAYGAIGDSLVSDCTIDQMADYANRFANYTLSDILVPEGEAKKGYKFMEFYVDDAALKQLVIDTFYVPAD